MAEEEKPVRKYVTNKELSLELQALRAELSGDFRALRSDVKLWILAAVALNQFLASVDLPSTLTGAAVLGVLGKSVVSLLFARGGGA